MFAETKQGNKLSSSRIAIGLLCGLAVCCAVMYVTSDGDEFVHEVVNPGKESGVARDAGTSVGSVDVLKVGQIYTDTPSGNMRLMDYFTNVEKEISTQVANRKSDIAAVRAKMAKDLAYNIGARAKLKRDMLHKMAINAKIAHDDLKKAMRKTQERFAKRAHIENRRYKATTRRDAKFKKAIDHDKNEQKHNLKLAVSAWQKATQAWSAQTNARIDRLNKHVAANAAQMKENARKAQKDLENTMHSWDHRVANFREESKRARSKLAAQFKAQSKACRAYASNKIKGLVASTAAQFNDVEIKMAKNRHEVDMAVRQASMRFQAALNSAKALEDKRFAKSVADIAAAKREAEEKTQAAATSFKVALLSMSSTVKEQVQKQNERIDHTADIVRSNAAAQAKVNANVNAEMTRMIKLGNERYAEHLKDDAELQKLINKQKTDTDKEMDAIALKFNSDLAKVRDTLAKDRKHAETQLKTKTEEVFNALLKNQEEQKAKNLKMAEDTRRMRIDAMNAVAKAKEDFQGQIKELAETVKENDKKADQKIKDLTGVVTENAVKSAQGREAIKALEESNKSELRSAIDKAIADGQKRAKQVEAYGKKLDKETKFKINTKLREEIHKLKEEVNGKVEALDLQSKEARDEMRKQLLYAIRSAKDVAKQELEAAVSDVKKKLAAYEEKAAAAKTASKEARTALQKEIADNAKELSREIRDAVANDARSQQAYKTYIEKKIKKTNTNLDAYANQMKKIADETRTEIKLAAKDITKKIQDEEKRADEAVKKFSSEDAARKKKVLTFLETELTSAAEEADKKFGEHLRTLAGHRKEADDQLASDIRTLNDALAKQAALHDIHFSKTVKDLAAARKEVLVEVGQLRKAMTTSVVKTTAMLKDVNSDLHNSIMVVAAEVIDTKAAQIAQNRKVRAEMKRIEKLSNDHFTASKKARGQLRRIMDENKQAAAAEVAQLKKETEAEVAKLRGKVARNKRQMAKDLTQATENFYEKLALQKKADAQATLETNAETTAAKLAAEADLKRAKKMFDTKIISLENTVVAHAKKAEEGITKITGVLHDINKAAAADRELIKDQTITLEADLHRAVARAISIGEAKAKASEQRIAEHLKETKEFMLVELSERTEAAADEVLKTIEGKRQKIADNYLSLKAYAVSVMDLVDDYVAKGKGRALSSVGTLLQTVGMIGAVKPKPAEGLGMGGDEMKGLFDGKEHKVSGAVATINGLVNEYSDSVGQVRSQWQMGLGKYLMDRLEMSMMDKGILQVDKVDGKSGNFVYINGRAVGLSNKLTDFSNLAASMQLYEASLSKLTAKLTAVTQPQQAKKAATVYAKEEWNGH